MAEEIDYSRLIYICEGCGTVKMYPTPEDAFNDGWDYPPRLGEFGVIGPRTCGNCGIDKTLWWKLVTARDVTDEKVPVSELPLGDLTPSQMRTFQRILGEPASIMADKPAE
ncbi:hypothetical protein [Lacticaseibacillus hegangensis]|uniref:Uncharacterized protein n=1 Tax=Lacticaseibacillus hegangensis TaxID=2486010 RepID=A0ABW4CW61_9LACO|nr:hypothetical protein [Lacticaseibacillus hegangensis]